MSAANDLLAKEVSELSAVVDSAVALLTGLTTQLKEAATMDEVKAIVAELEVQKEELAEAVATNTIAEDEKL